MNVVDLREFKKKQELARRDDAYKKYLTTLGHGQLEIEVKSLINNDNNDSSSQKKDLITRGKLLMKELANRAEGKVKSKILSLNKNCD